MRFTKCDYCKKDIRTREIVKAEVAGNARMLCTKCACFLMLDEMERVKKWIGYVNNFMAKQFPKQPAGGWQDIGRV